MAETETAKRITLGSNKSDAFLKLRTAIKERGEAKAAGNTKKVAELDKLIEQLDSEFDKRGGGQRNKLDATPEEVLKMKPAEGEALVIVKTMKGTLCFKTHLAREVENKRVTVAIKEIYPYDNGKKEEKK